MKARVNQRSLADSATDIQKTIGKAAGQGYGNEFGAGFAQGFERQSPRIQAAAIKAAAATKSLREETERFNDALKSGDTDKITRASSRLETAHKRNESAARSLSNAQALAAGTAAELAETTASAGAAMGKAGPAVAALAGGLGVLVSVASAASGVLALLPGVVATGAAGFGAMALATSGFGDALENLGDPEKFALALRELSPNAIAAARDLRNLTPVFDDLKRSAQEALFDGVGAQITQVATRYAPDVEKLASGIAGAVNTGFDAIATQLNDPGTGTAIDSTLKNIVDTFQNLAPSMGPLTQAFAQLASVGSSFLPELATAATKAAQSFADMVESASSSGDLDEFIQRGIDTIGDMLDVISNVTELFFELGPAGESAMSTIATSVEFTNNVLGALRGNVDDLTNLFPSFGESVVSSFNNIGSIIEFTLLSPLRGAIELLNKIPGIELPTIPQLTKFNPDGSVDRGKWGGGGGSFGPPGAAPGSRGPGGRPGGTPGSLAGGPGSFGGLGTSAIVAPTGPSWGPAKSPFAWDPKTGGYGVPGTGSGSAGLPNPATAYTGDPLSILRDAGLTADSSNYGAAQAILERRHDVEEKRQKLNAMERDSTASADDIVRARNDVMQAEQDAYKAELSLRDKQIDASQQYAKSLTSMSETFSDVLDKDFGISKGLPGIAENLTRFVGTLATAGFRGQLKAVEASDPGWQARLAAQTGTTTGGYASSPFGPSSSYGVGQGGYPGDAALLSNVRPGSYVSQAGVGDLTKGIGDCTSSIEDLVNMLDGQPTAGRSLSTGNAASWLPQHGFVPGMGGPGDFRVGFNASHAQATLPDGTPWNWGSDAAAARGGVGGTGAFDPSFTDHWFRPTAPANITPSAPPTSPGGGIFSPANTNPGLNNPAASWGPGGISSPLGAGGQGYGIGQTPGMVGQSASAPIAPVGGPGPGGWQPSATPNQGLGSMAGAAAAMAFPGAGEAAAKAGQLIDRSVKFGGQLAGIGVSGLMETFGLSSPDGGNGTGDLSKSWVGRLASGLAQVSPAHPSTAGQTAPQKNPDAHEGSGNPPGPNYSGVVIQGDFVQSPDRKNGQQIMNDLAFQSHAAKSSP